MGWLSRRRPPRPDRLPMKILLIVLALISGHAHAATVPMSAPSGVTHAAGGWTTASNFVGSFSGASFNNNFSANVAGKAVTMPASMRIAANAGQFAATTMRMSPAGLIGGALAAWLLSKGLEWIDGQWQTKPISSDPVADKYWYGYGPCQSAAAQCGFEQVYSIWANSQGSGYEVRLSAPWQVFSGYVYTSFEIRYQTGPWSNGGHVTIYYGGSAPAPVYQPATQEDWDRLAASPLPDAAAQQLAEAGKALPLDDPSWDNPYQDVPLSDPKTDPVTGEKYRDAARVTPNPDGTSADVEPYREPLDDNGDPIPDPQKPGETKKEAELNKDPCETATDRLSCIEKGQADDLDLDTQNQGSAVSPVSVGGGGSCPPDKVIALHGGTATFSYQPICQLATMINPLVIAFAWLSAGFILIGAFRE